MKGFAIGAFALACKALYTRGPIFLNPFLQSDPRVNDVRGEGIAQRVPTRLGGRDLGVGVWNLVTGVWGLRSVVLDSGFGVWDLGFGVRGLGIGVWSQG